MEKIFFIGCPHWGHSNILLYEPRPYKNIEEMDQILINNWNSVIKTGDTVFILGDLVFCNKEKASDIISSLNGHKILILGNHDRGHSINWFIDIGINNVYKYPIIYKKFWMLSHEPLYVNDHMPYVNIHSHLHSKKMDSKQYFNVSAECINYTPIDFEDIKKQVMGESVE